MKTAVKKNSRRQIKVSKATIPWEKVLVRISEGESVSKIATDMKVPRRTTAILASWK